MIRVGNLCQGRLGSDALLNVSNVWIGPEAGVEEHTLWGFDGAIAAVWLDSAGKCLELQDVHEGEFGLKDAAEGLALAALVKRGIERSLQHVVLAKYTASGSFNDYKRTFRIEVSLVQPLASIGVEVSDIAIVFDDRIYARFGKIASRPE